MAPYLPHLRHHRDQSDDISSTLAHIRLQVFASACSLTWNALAPPFLLSNNSSSFKAQLKCPFLWGASRLPVQKGLLPVLPSHTPEALCPKRCSPFPCPALHIPAPGTEPDPRCLLTEWTSALRRVVFVNLSSEASLAGLNLRSVTSYCVASSKWLDPSEPWFPHL